MRPRWRSILQLGHRSSPCPRALHACHAAHAARRRCTDPLRNQGSATAARRSAAVLDYRRFGSGLASATERPRRTRASCSDVAQHSHASSVHASCRSAMRPSAASGARRHCGRYRCHRDDASCSPTDRCCTQRLRATAGSRRSRTSAFASAHAAAPRIRNLFRRPVGLEALVLAADRDASVTTTPTSRFLSSDVSTGSPTEVAARAVGDDHLRVEVWDPLHRHAEAL